ncbi:MAG: hypothetical protein M5U28_03415 [Sandaracinaceae bacterium]|nr:hypothetical protein [Sandaracinaceae bacterium]
MSMLEPLRTRTTSGPYGQSQLTLPIASVMKIAESLEPLFIVLLRAALLLRRLGGGTSSLLIRWLSGAQVPAKPSCKLVTVLEH